MTENDDLIMRLVDKCIGLAIQGEQHRIHAEHLLDKIKQMESEKND